MHTRILTNRTTQLGMHTQAYRMLAHTGAHAPPDTAVPTYTPWGFYIRSHMQPFTIACTQMQAHPQVHTQDQSPMHVHKRKCAFLMAQRLYTCLKTQDSLRQAHRLQRNNLSDAVLFEYMNVHKYRHKNTDPMQEQVSEVKLGKAAVFPLSKDCKIQNKQKDALCTSWF